MFSIGEFSKITGLTVKALRFYHDQGLLAPSYVDEQTGYRYYYAAKVEIARLIVQLRALDCSVQQIGEILAGYHDDGDLLDFLQRHKEAIDAEARRVTEISRRLTQLIHHQQEARIAMRNVTFEIQEKTLPSQWIAGIRMRGKYSDCGSAFGKLGRKFGRWIAGPPLLLCYDTEVYLKGPGMIFQGNPKKYLTEIQFLIRATS